MGHATRPHGRPQGRPFSFLRIAYYEVFFCYFFFHDFSTITQLAKRFT